MNKGPKSFEGIFDGKLHEVPETKFLRGQLLEVPFELRQSADYIVSRHGVVAEARCLTVKEKPMFQVLGSIYTFTLEHFDCIMEYPKVKEM